MFAKLSLLAHALLLALLVSHASGACPNKCSGHGRCGKDDVCECMQNWAGGDCGARVCPFARAWHDTAMGDDDAHYYQECSNRGTCDRDKGVCDCDSGFTGSGCRRLACPDDCSGHGTCEFIEDLAGNGYDKRVGGKFGRTYTLWDQEKIMGCRCDPLFEGHNCAKRVCPKGDDPLTTEQYNMVQAIIIKGITAPTEGFLTYHDPYGMAWTTDRITWDDTAAATTCTAVETALRRMPNNVLNTVAVTSVTDFSPFTRTPPTSDIGDIGARKLVDATNLIICQVEFQSEPGTTGFQNLLECNLAVHNAPGQHPSTAGDAAASCEVLEVFNVAVADLPATLTDVSRPFSELAECANRGQCDATTGMCKCYTGHMGLACQKQEALV